MSNKGDESVELPRDLEFAVQPVRVGRMLMRHQPEQVNQVTAQEGPMGPIPKDSALVGQMEEV